LQAKKKKSIMEMVYRYEDGELSWDQEVYMFSELLDSGLVWALKGKRGCYGQRAMELIKQGAIAEPIAHKTFGNHDYRAMPKKDLTK
tara:strand:- start:155 stop:415 length:261 start_codon:yes stop_codon:yes gene_type:complete